MIPIFIALLHEFKLLERVTQTNNVLLLIIILSYILVGWSGMNRNGFINQLIKNFFRISPKENDFNESLKINFGSSFLLFLNLFISLNCCCFLLVKNYFSFWDALIVSLVTSVIFLSLQQIGYRFVLLLTGNLDVSAGITTINRNTWQFGGVLILIFATIWTLNIKQYETMSYSFLILLFLLLTLRIIKGIYFSYKKRIKWYYFILYLCTLEITPAFIYLKTAFMYFQMKM